MEDKQDETMKERIIGLLDRGYTRSQLIRDFRYAERTVDAAIRARKERNNANEGPRENTMPIADDALSLPSQAIEEIDVQGLLLQLADFQCVGQPPGEYIPAVPVHDDHQVEESPCHRDIGNVRRPHLVQPCYL